MEEEVEDLMKASLRKARILDRSGQAEQAYTYYSIVAELCPATRPEIEKELTDVLCEWGLKLENEGRFRDLCVCYKKSLETYPNNPRMLTNFAAHLLRNDDPVSAVRYLKRALRIDPEFLPAERNLQNAYSMAVERWHFPMLNDRRRNGKFERAIRRRIRQGYDTVLDIGSGTGLLSLYARDAGAERVYACDYSPVMVDIARKVFARNNANDIMLIPKYSLDLSVPDDIPERVKLIVTETFDAGLFGEFVVPSMISAHLNLLDANGGGMIIPMSATLYTAAVECEYIRYRSSVLFDNIRAGCPLDFAGVSGVPDTLHYDTENLDYVKINYVTEPQQLLTVNFNDLAELKEFIEDGVKGATTTKCRYDGIVDGLVAWFKLHLDEEITIDSSEWKSCWQLAVFPGEPRPCEQGDLLSIEATMASFILTCSNTLSSAGCDDEPRLVFRLPTEVIVFLNDARYVETLSVVGKAHADRKIRRVLDTSPFPVYGLSLLKENDRCEALYFEPAGPQVRSFVEKIAENNGVKDKLRFISDYKEIDCVLDSVLVHNFDVKGELKDWGQDSCQEFFSTLLSPEGILLPERIFLMGQLVFSEDLPKMVFVNDANLQRPTSGACSSSSSGKESDEEPIIPNIDDESSTHYVIGEYINEYKIPQIFDLNSSVYLYEPSTDIYTLAEINEKEISETVVNFGRVNVTERKPLPNALICWYKIQLTADHVLETKRKESFMNHMAILLEDDLKDVISREEEVKVKIYQAKGLVRISILKHS